MGGALTGTLLLDGDEQILRGETAEHASWPPALIDVCHCPITIADVISGKRGAHKETLKGKGFARLSPQSLLRRGFAGHGSGHYLQSARTCPVVRHWLAGLLGPDWLDGQRRAASAPEADFSYTLDSDLVICYNCLCSPHLLAQSAVQFHVPSRHLSLLTYCMHQSLLLIRHMFDKRGIEVRSRVDQTGMVEMRLIYNYTSYRSREHTLNRPTVLQALRCCAVLTTCRAGPPSPRIDSVQRRITRGCRRSRHGRHSGPRPGDKRKAEGRQSTESKGAEEAEEFLTEHKSTAFMSTSHDVSLFSCHLGSCSTPACVSPACSTLAPSSSLQRG